MRMCASLADPRRRSYDELANRDFPPMSDSPFQQLAAERAAGGPAAALDRLTQTLLEQQDYHKLFDARMLKRKFELGLPLARPASLQDVPEDQRKVVEETYVAAAREAGQ